MFHQKHLIYAEYYQEGTFDFEPGNFHPDLSPIDPDSGEVETYHPGHMVYIDNADDMFTLFTKGYEQIKNKEEMTPNEIEGCIHLYLENLITPVTLHAAGVALLEGYVNGAGYKQEKFAAVSLNDGRTLHFTQKKKDGFVYVYEQKPGEEIYKPYTKISAPDVVRLLNYYRQVEMNRIPDGFLNPAPAGTDPADAPAGVEQEGQE